jgi:carboxymethylenebutenolidase
MTVRREESEIKTSDGTARAWWYGGGEGPRAAVLLYPDAGGVRPSFHAMAERLARMGYVVMLPNVHYRAGDYAPFDMATAFSVPSERARIMDLVASLTVERMAVDSGAYLEAIAARSDVRKDRIGITGYCMGGRMSFLTAGAHPDKVRAAASFHGGSLATDKPESPHRLADRIRASLHFGIADPDAGCPPEQQAVLAAALGAAHVDYRIELYPGKKHGFAVPDHGAAYDREAAERHWRHLEAFFGETLA